MKRKQLDAVWVLAMCALLALLLLPQTRSVFAYLTASHPYLMGFAKFMILGTMGEFLAVRIASEQWNKPIGIKWKALLKGGYGILVTLAFKIFTLTSLSILSGNTKLTFALFASISMNLIFGPSFFTLHKFTDTFIDLKVGKREKHITVEKLVNSINWVDFYRFMIFRSIPFFWIPIHTMVFLLPEAYRIIVSAFLAVALSVFLAMSNKSTKQNHTVIAQ